MEPLVFLLLLLRFTPSFDTLIIMFLGIGLILLGISGLSGSGRLCPSLGWESFQLVFCLPLGPLYCKCWSIWDCHVSYLHSFSFSLFAALIVLVPLSCFQVHGSFLSLYITCCWTSSIVFFSSFIPHSCEFYLVLSYIFSLLNFYVHSVFSWVQWASLWLLYVELFTR